MRKITAIIMIFVLSFAMVFIYPAKQANANPLAVGGALYLGGAGIYVVGTLGVAAIAGLIELDSCPSCQDDLEAHAKNTWAAATANAKAGLQLMVDASVGLGNSLTATDSGFNSWMDTQINSFGDLVANMKVPEATIETGNYSIVKKPNEAVLTMVAGSQMQVVWGTSNATNGSVIKMDALIDGKLRFVRSAGSIQLTTGLTQAEIGARLASITTPFQMAQLWNSFVVNDSSYSTYLMKVTVLNSSWNEAYNTSINQAREAWEDMKDAGLVLPTDSARLVNDYGPVTYDPTTDSYAGIDGVNVAREDIYTQYPNVRYKTEQDLLNAGAAAGAAAGLYIDGWTGTDSTTSTYDPATDMTTTTTTTTTTSTNVTTGETVTSTTSATSTTTGDTTGNPTTGEPPPPSAPTATNPFKGKVPVTSLLGLWELLVALIWYLIRLFTFVATLALIAPTEITNPYFQWFTTVQILGITPYPLVQNLALFFLGFSIYKSVRRVF